MPKASLRSSARKRKAPLRFEARPASSRKCGDARSPPTSANSKEHTATRQRSKSPAAPRVNTRTQKIVHQHQWDIRFFWQSSEQFIREQTALLSSPRKKQVHAARAKSIAQKILVTLSSLCYLIPSYAYAKTGDEVGKWLFVVVAIFSGLADGSWFEGCPILKFIDKWTATSGGIYAALPKLWPFAAFKVFLQFLVGMSFSISWLMLARRTPINKTWEWVMWQSVWHLVSGCALARSVFCAANGAGCPL